jgi:hypothetical protein
MPERALHCWRELLNGSTMEHSPELQEQFEAMRKNLGFVPNSILIMPQTLERRADC